MIYLCIIIETLIIFAAAIYIYFLVKPIKRDSIYQDKFKNAAHELKEKFDKEKEEQIKLQKAEIEKEIQATQNDLDCLNEHYNTRFEAVKKDLDKLADYYNQQKEELQNSLQNYIESEHKAATDKISQEKENITKKLCELDEEYRRTVETEKVKLEQIRQEYENEELILNQKIEKKRKEVNNLIEVFKKDEEIRKELDFYRITITPEVQEDISKLKMVAAQLKNPVILYKLIYKEYYEKGFNSLIGRVLGADKNRSGIYKITNTKNQMCYIGQAVDISSRWRTHIKRGLRCEAQTNNKLYSCMWEEGVENFTFQVLEFCEKDQLTERERFFIEYFQAKDYGYNSKM